MNHENVKVGKRYYHYVDGKSFDHPGKITISEVIGIGWDEERPALTLVKVRLFSRSVWDGLEFEEKLAVIPASWLLYQAPDLPEPKKPWYRFW